MTKEQRNDINYLDKHKDKLDAFDKTFITYLAGRKKDFIVNPQQIETIELLLGKVEQ